MTNPTTPTGEPISLPEVPELLPSLLFSAMQEWAEAEAGDQAEEAFEHVTRKYRGAMQAYARTAVLADRAHRAASPDVAKMVEHLKGWVRLNVVLGDIQRMLCGQLDALGAAATQANPGVCAEAPRGQWVIRATDDLSSELSRDSDGDVAIDWITKDSDMLSMSLSKSGLLTWAVNRAGPQGCGKAQLNEACFWTLNQVLEEAEAASTATQARAAVGAAPSQVQWQTPPPSWRLLAKAAIDLLWAIDTKHDNEKPPMKYAVPYGAVNQLRAALGCAEDLPVAQTPGEGWKLVPREFVAGFCTLVHNWSLKAESPVYYHGVERDAFAAAYRECGQALAKLRPMLDLPKPPATPGEA